MVTIQLLQAVLALLLAVQNNPAVTDATRAQALMVASQVVQYVNTPQTLGVITSPRDGTVWKAGSENLAIQWAKVKAGDERWWNPPYLRIDLEGKFDGVHSEERPVTGTMKWNEDLPKSHTISTQILPAGNYRVFVIGLVNPTSGAGAWALTAPADIVVQ
jgi:hypothetical protein